MNTALEKAWKAERPRLIGWMSGRIGREDAEDALQDLIARTVANLDALDGVRDVAAWLWRGARNAVIDVWRSRARRKARDAGSFEELEELVEDVRESAGGEVETAELLDALREAIALLPPGQREVIVAQSLNGETFAAISARTGIPVNTLAARKRYALAKLSDSLESFALEDFE